MNDNGYIDAINLAVESLRQISPQSMSNHTGAVWDPGDKTIGIHYLDRVYRIKHPGIDFIDPLNLTEKERIIILHYLASPLLRPQKKGEQGPDYISFREIETGLIYYPSFRDRVIKPFSARFGNSPGRFLERAKNFRGSPSLIEEFSYSFKCLPLIDIIFILYPADSEFPADAQVLFKQTIEEFLDIEDIAILCEEISSRL